MAGSKAACSSKKLNVPIRVVVQLGASLKELEDHLVWTATHVGDALTAQGRRILCNRMQLWSWFSLCGSFVALKTMVEALRSIDPKNLPAQKVTAFSRLSMPCRDWKRRSQGEGKRRVRQ